MTALNLTATDNRQKTVLEHLIPLVSNALAEKINNGVIIEKDGKRLINKKDLSTFMTYAAEEAKKMLSDKERKGIQAVCVHGDDIMSWAIHYFEEDSIEGKLYNEDGTEYKPPKSVCKPNTPTIPYIPPKPKPEPQLSMFDLLGEQKKDESAPIEITNQTDDHEPAEEADEEPTEEEITEAITTNNTTVTEPDFYVNQETGEVLPVEEMQKYDGDIEEPDVPTVTKIVSGFKEQEISLGEKAEDIKQAGQIMQQLEELSDDDDFPPLDTKAYDIDALSILDTLFGNTMILR